MMPKFWVSFAISMFGVAQGCRPPSSSTSESLGSSRNRLSTTAKLCQREAERDRSGDPSAKASTYAEHYARGVCNTSADKDVCVRECLSFFPTGSDESPLPAGEGTSETPNTAAQAQNATNQAQDSAMQNQGCSLQNATVEKSARQTVSTSSLASVKVELVDYITADRIPLATLLADRRQFVVEGPGHFEAVITEGQQTPRKVNFIVTETACVKITIRLSTQTAAP